MIVKKLWCKRMDGGRTVYTYTGWFLFGILPLYIDRSGLRVV